VTDPFQPFVADAANSAALAAARTVAEATRSVYGPLVIAGARGAGKSHLLRAIRDKAVLADPSRQAPFGDRINDLNTIAVHDVH
jgi:chromosomal replication initiation ATPase DnaA